MATVSFIKPLDQPLGTRRLLNDLISSINSKLYTDFYLIVAYAKTGPLYRMIPHLMKWHNCGNKTRAIFGFDQRGTSYEALKLALQLFDEIYVTQEDQITFHPKIYMFFGPKKARALIGSNNLTVGGTETNFEATVDIELSNDSDSEFLDEIKKAWDNLLPKSCAASQVLNNELLERLLREGKILDEKQMRMLKEKVIKNEIASKPIGQRPRILLKPPSLLPKALFEKPSLKKTTSTKVKKSREQLITGSPDSSAATGLAIQIKPHHNGEILLSVLAKEQNPSFFGWPFQGHTNPKKPGNPSYPQRVPDPIVNITVYGESSIPMIFLPSYSLNTIYYSKKSEIRITASPLVSIVPEYSIMIMELSPTPSIDYEITIYTPSSPEYQTWLGACNQEIPGSSGSRRKFGWF